MQIARVSQQPVRPRNMIDLVINSVPGPQRALGTLLPPTPPLLAVVGLAGELVPQSHPPSGQRGVRMSLLMATTVKARMATRIVVSANLLPATLPMAAGAAEAQAALAEALEALAVQVVLGAPAVEVVTCHGIRFGRC